MRLAHTQCRQTALLPGRCPPCRHQRRQRRATVPRAAVAPSPTRQELRDKLTDALGESLSVVGDTPDSVLAITKELEELGKREPVEVTEDLVRGRFVGVLNNFPNVDRGGTSLGTLTFGQFGPKELSVGLQGIDLLQSVERPGQYETKTFFQVREGPHEGLWGIQTALGEYALPRDKPSRQDVFFLGIRIEPRDTSPEGLERWRAALGEANPSMREDGMCEYLFPKKIPGFRDFILLDHELQATLGNRGSLVIVRREEGGWLSLQS